MLVYLPEFARTYEVDLNRKVMKCHCGAEHSIAPFVLWYARQQEYWTPRLHWNICLAVGETLFERIYRKFGE